MDSDSQNANEDRRRHQREPVRQPATVDSGDFGSFETLIQNYSESGLYLTPIEGGAIIDHAIASQFTQGCEVFVRVKVGSRGDQMCAARVDRIGDMGLGVEFYQPQQTLCDALTEVAKEQGFHDQSATLDSGDKQKLKKSIGETALDGIAQYFGAFLTQAQEDLMDAASHAAGGSGQTPYFEAMSILRRQGDDLKEAYLGRLKDHLKEFKREELFPELKARSGESELSLVNENEFEDWLSLSDTIHSVEQRNHQSLHALEARLTILLGTMVDASNNPVSPAALCHHLYQVFLDQPFEHDIRLILWKGFGREVAQHVESVYSKINQLLIDAGILPKLTFRYSTPARARPAPAPAAGPPAAQPESGEQAAAEGHPHQPAGFAPPAPSGGASPGVLTPIPTPSGPLPAADTMGTSDGAAAPPAAQGTPSAATIIDLRDILLERQQAAARGRKKGRTSKATPFGMEELNDALIDLQQRDETVGAPLTNRINEALAKRFGKRSKRAVADHHANAIFLAQQLLDAIASDDVVEPQAKHWIRQLEIPLLRLLLKDDSLLRDSAHPAREVIDQLGRAHIDPSADAGDREKSITRKIDGIVDGLSQLEEPDRASFASAANELQDLLKRQQRLRAAQMRRALEAAEGQHRLAKARDRVQRELDRRFSGGSIPKVIVNLLDLGLRNLLDLAAVREGLESDDWRDSIGVIDHLRERLSSEHEPSEADVAESKALLEQVEAKLNSAGADAGGRDDVLAEIRNILPGLREPESDVSPELVDYETGEPEEAEAADDDPDQSLWRGRAKLLETGSWLLLPGSDNKMEARKLAWVSDERDRFVFVDRHGRKSMELGLDELAKRLRSNEADVVGESDKSLMERSWQGMIEQMHEQIAHQATHDQLTGALNRKEFERQLRLKLGESKLMHSQHVVLQVDLDQFKVINSTAGHDAGDQLLRDVAGLLETATPEEAAVARLSGDEFAILLPRHEVAPGHETADRVRKAVSKHQTKWKRRKLKTTASIGLVAINCDTESVSLVLNQMESACAAAKEAGNDRVKSYQLDDQEMNQRDQAMHWVSVVERAIDNDNLMLEAQRIISLEGDDDQEHYEVLVRMYDEEGKLVSPEEFVPAAEVYGRIHFLDEWVFRKTFESLANSPRQDQIARLSINVSGKTFSRPRFADSVQAMLEETGVSPSKICFEITETAAISNLSRCTDFLRQLRYLGCRFSLDDFGTGLSSFSYLKHLPVDYLKIDGSFVKEIVNSRADYGLVKSINEIGHFLGKQTVAEYVENDEIREQLVEIGVDFAQGFGVARPIPLDQILEL